MYTRIVAGAVTVPDFVPREVADVVCGLMHINPRQRLKSYAQLELQPWLSSVNLSLPLTRENLQAMTTTPLAPSLSEGPEQQTDGRRGGQHLNPTPQFRYDDGSGGQAQAPSGGSYQRRLPFQALFAKSRIRQSHQQYSPSPPLDIGGQLQHSDDKDQDRDRVFNLLNELQGQRLDAQRGTLLSTTPHSSPFKALPSPQATSPYGSEAKFGGLRSCESSASSVLLPSSEAYGMSRMVPPPNEATASLLTFFGVGGHEEQEAATECEDRKVPDFPNFDATMALDPLPPPSDDEDHRVLSGGSESSALGLSARSSPSVSHHRDNLSESRHTNPELIDAPGAASSALKVEVPYSGEKPQLFPLDAAVEPTRQQSQQPMGPLAVEATQDGPKPMASPEVSAPYCNQPNLGRLSVSPKSLPPRLPSPRCLSPRLPSPIVRSPCSSPALQVEMKAMGCAAPRPAPCSWPRSRIARPSAKLKEQLLAGGAGISPAFSPAPGGRSQASADHVSYIPLRRVSLDAIILPSPAPIEHAAHSRALPLRTSSPSIPATTYGRRCLESTTLSDGTAMPPAKALDETVVARRSSSPFLIGRPRALSHSSNAFHSRVAQARAAYRPKSSRSPTTTA